MRGKREKERELWVVVGVFYPGHDVGNTGDAGDACAGGAMVMDAGESSSSCRLGMAWSLGSEAGCKQLLADRGWFRC